MRPSGNSINPNVGIYTSGLVNFMIHAMLSNKITRATSASPSPILRASTRRSGGSFPVKIDKNTMLSMPSTISGCASVNSAMHYTTKIMVRTAHTGSYIRGKHHV